MELLSEISDRDVGLKNHNLRTYNVRRAARAVLFNSRGLIAFLHVSKYNYHKLPGGGVEKGENIEKALRREILEEVGYDCKIGRPIGVIVEYREEFKLLQMSYCFIAKVKGKTKGTKFTHKERSEGFELSWHSLNEAISIICKDIPINYEGKFIVRRDLIFLKKAKELTRN